MTKYTTFDPAKGKTVLIGKIDNKILYKNVKPKHFMRIMDGYGIQYQAFVDLQKKVNKICIIEENGQRWLATWSEWNKNGRVADYGNGKQMFLSLKFMHKTAEKREEPISMVQAFANMPEATRIEIRKKLGLPV